MSKTAQVIISIIILLILIGGSAYLSEQMLTVSSQRLVSHINEIERYTENDDWEKAKSSVSNIENDWDKTQKIWCTLIDHMEIDNVNNSMSKISRFVQYKEKAMALSETSTLKEYVKHVPDRMSFSIENIF